MVRISPSRPANHYVINILESHQSWGHFGILEFGNSLVTSHTGL